MSTPAEKMPPGFDASSVFAELRRSLPPVPPPANDGFILPLPPVRRALPSPSAEMRAKGAALAEELLRHVAEPWPEGEPRWSVAELLAEDRDA